MRQRRLTTLAIGAVITAIALGALAALAAPAATGAGNDSVNGGGSQCGVFIGCRHVSISAHVAKLGPPKGSLTIQMPKGGPYPAGTYKADVTCLDVAGAVAYAGVVMTSAPDDQYLGHRSVHRFEDRGGREDDLYAAVGNTDDCRNHRGFETPAPLIHGSVAVHDGWE